MGELTNGLELDAGQEAILADLFIMPERDDYQTAPIDEAFDWTDIVERAVEHRNLDPDKTLYLFVFNSVANPDADQRKLEALDRAVHIEALQSQGYVTYFQGEMNDNGKNISFCIWERPEDARAATSTPIHLEAAQQGASEFYQTHWLDFYTLNRDESGQVVPQAISAK